MSSNSSTTLSAQATISNGALRRVHHIALNVRDMQVSCDFYGSILGLHQLIGDEVPSTLIDLVAAGKVLDFGQI
jgi:glyoxylase I family protein